VSTHLQLEPGAALVAGLLFARPKQVETDSGAEYIRNCVAPNSLWQALTHQASPKVRRAR